MAKKFTLEEASSRLKEKGIEYECIKYLGYHSSESDFIHIPTNTGPQKGRYSNILSGKHPSWSPACKNRQDIDETIANERLLKINSEYRCVDYCGYHSKNSLFIHTPTNTGPKKSRYGKILAGWHPSWSPACKSRRDIDETIVNERLREANREYECTKYAGSNSKKSLFIHIPTNTGPKEGRYTDILYGQHPSWSPACKSRKDIDETIVNERLKETNREYKCVNYCGSDSKNSLFIHIPTNTGPKKSRYDHIVNGHHPSWSPASKFDWPSNDKLCIVYFCKTKTYGYHGKYRNGPYLTIGITVKETARQRYQGNGHIETYFELETYNCIIHEKALLKKITVSLGKPEAGWEAWVFSNERKEKMTRIFNEHFNLLST